MNAWKWMVILSAATLTTAACNVIIGAGEPIVVDESNSISDGQDDADASKNDASNGAICGDGILQAGEECDDGNSDPKDGCDNCALRCLEGEVPNGLAHRCYRVAPGSAAMSWDEAEADCVTRGGHLLSINSAEELGFFSDRVKAGVWIGGHGDGMMFVWTSGEPWWSGAPWATNPPTPASDTCVAMQSVSTPESPTTVFAVQDCNNALSYICERVPAGTLP